MSKRPTIVIFSSDGFRQHSGQNFSGNNQHRYSPGWDMVELTRIHKRFDRIEMHSHQVPSVNLPKVEPLTDEWEPHDVDGDFHTFDEAE